MIIAAAIPIGLVIGSLLGGRIEAVGDLRLRVAWLAIVGFAVQLVLFALPPGDLVEAAGPAVYVASTAAVLVALLANLRVPGLAVVALGALSNLAAVTANGGFMPTTPGALAAAGLSGADGYSNSTVIANPALAPLTDVLAIPAGIPFANVFSVGDVLIAVGIVVAIAAAMRRAPAPAPAPDGRGAARPLSE